MRVQKFNFEENVFFVVGVVHKLQEQCPLKYKLNRAVSSINPNFIYSNAQLAKSK